MAVEGGNLEVSKNSLSVATSNGLRYFFSIGEVRLYTFVNVSYTTVTCMHESC